MMESTPHRQRRLLIVVVLVTGCAAGFLLLRTHSNHQQDLEEARRALQRRDAESALRISGRVLRDRPQHPDALLLAAISSAELADYDQAIEHCRSMPQEAGSAYVDAQCMAGNIFFNHLGDLSQAESAFRAALAADRSHRVALEALSQLLSLQTRTWELIPIHLELIRQDVITPTIVLALIQGDLLYPDAALLERLRRTDPDHAGLLLAESRLAALRNDLAAAISLARQAAAADPSLIEAHARLGRLLLKRGTLNELQDWEASLPESALDHPETWIALGELAQSKSDPAAAAKCYREAGVRDPAMLAANYKLGKQVALLNREAEAARLMARARWLEQYRKLFDHGPGSPVDLTPERLKTGIGLAEQLGLRVEAYGLARLASELVPRPPWAAEMLARLRPSPVDNAPRRVSEQQNIFRDISLSGAESVPPHQPAGGIPGIPPPSLDAAIGFEEVSREVGLDFQFDNGVDQTIGGAQRPYDFTGGGIAAFDFDVDGWPDLYLTQGCALDDDSGQPIDGEPDQLFRNLLGRRFTNISHTSLPPDLDYSQGVSAGDWNNDGFPDVFVANLGTNRLMLNNGDGTFSNVSPAIEDDAGRWTTSCLICDLNADGAPDLYSLNYLSGDIVSRVCRDESGRLNSCAPQSFDAAQDQLHLGDGAGRFIDATDESGIRRPNGKGLGLIAADIDSDRELDLYIANDGVPNFLFLKQSTGRQLFFQEAAMERGVAVNREGLSEAGMGVVAEDLDQDGRLELFVTNFLDETNTLYSESGAKGFFDDRTWESGLGESSVAVLGFGVQAVDAELDGYPDLIIANGHVDDFSDMGVPHRMPPQFFRNVGARTFWERPAELIGEFFPGRYLGRAVTRLDWNRDGAEEVAVGMLDEPTRLLRNTTNHRGRSLAVSLRAESGQRDAIGALVSVVQSTGHVTRRQLVAGDGYQTTNEKQLVFGLGQDEGKVDIHIEWPNGATQIYAGVAPDGRYMAVEGSKRLYDLCQWDLSPQ